MRHGDLLVNTSIVEDPIYLTEPFVRTTTLAWRPERAMAPPSVLEIVDEVAARQEGYVPHYPMGTHHTEFAERFGLPYEATQGGANTLYPEYVRELAMMAQPSAASGAPVADAGPLGPVASRPAGRGASGHRSAPGPRRRVPDRRRGRQCRGARERPGGAVGRLRRRGCSR